jgi:hypothetical protein
MAFVTFCGHTLSVIKKTVGRMGKYTLDTPTLLIGEQATANEQQGKSG